MQLQPFDPAARTALPGRAARQPRRKKATPCTCDEVQAFMLALLSAPDALDTAKWLPEALGDEVFLFKQRRARRSGSAGVGHGTCRYANTSSGKTLPELWLYADAAGNDDFFTGATPISTALHTVPTDWFEAIDEEAFEDLFYPVMALAGACMTEDEGGEPCSPSAPKSSPSLRAKLPHTLLACLPILAHHHPQTPNRAA